jgi:formamidopyrimidine-DNA glycosylase
MPELPEVEAMAALARTTLGTVLRRVERLDPQILAAADADALAGRSIREVRRRGKHLLLDLDGQTLSMHFRMTGTLRPWGGRSGPSLRLGFVGDEGSLALHDPRRLAEVRVLGRSQLATLEMGHGPEPWPLPLPGATVRERLTGTRPLKVALLDPRGVAGLGNIAASEICWRARLDPRRSCRDLAAPHWAALAEAIHLHLAETLDRLRIAPLELMSAGGHVGNPFLVYGRAGEPCARCGGVIGRFVLAGRGTWWCRACVPSLGAAPRGGSG